LEQSGYRTGIFGKYLNRWDITLPPPYFHRWAITGASETSRNGYYDMTFNVQGTLRTIEQYSTDYIASKAVRFLRSSERDDSRPWFLYVATPAPHPPAIPAPKYRDARVTRFYPNPAVKESDRTDKPEYIRNASADMENVRRLRRRQLRTLMSVDDLVEQIFRELHENREGRRTLAVFTSDNGLAWGEHGWTGKRVPYTSSIGIPLSVRWPGRFPQGAVDIRIAANIDIGPTIFQAVGIEPELPVDGRSLLADWFRNRIHTEYWRSRLSAPPTWASTRGAQYQYIEYYDAEGNVRFREYYDLIRDPWQLTNLLGDADPGNDPSAEQLAELSAQLAADRSCSGQLCP
jgi:arylsulfatase A-like enzyme